MTVAVSELDFRLGVVHVITMRQTENKRRAANLLREEGRISLCMFYLTKIMANPEGQNATLYMKVIEDICEKRMCFKEVKIW
jgi:hypothetical protein